MTAAGRGPVPPLRPVRDAGRACPRLGRAAGEWPQAGQRPGRGRHRAAVPAGRRLVRGQPGRPVPVRVPRQAPGRRELGRGAGAGCRDGGLLAAGARPGPGGQARPGRARADHGLRRGQRGDELRRGQRRLAQVGAGLRDAAGVPGRGGRPGGVSSPPACPRPGRAVPVAGRRPAGRVRGAAGAGPAEHRRRAAPLAAAQGPAARGPGPAVARAPSRRRSAATVARPAHGRGRRPRGSWPGSTSGTGRWPTSRPSGWPASAPSWRPRSAWNAGAARTALRKAVLAARDGSPR